MIVHIDKNYFVNKNSKIDNYAIPKIHNREQNIFRKGDDMSPAGFWIQTS